MRSIKYVSLLSVLLCVQSIIFAALPADNSTYVVSTVSALGATGNSPGTTSNVRPFTMIGGNIDMNTTSDATKNTLGWYSLFPMEGAISLNDQNLQIHNDLIFSGTGQFDTIGTIYGNDNRIVFAPRTTGFPAGATIDITNTSTVVTTDMVHTVTACAWTYDGKYMLALHTGASAKNDRLEAYSYEPSGAGTITTEAIVTGTGALNRDAYSTGSIASGGDNSVSCISCAPQKTSEGNYLIAVGQNYTAGTVKGVPTNVNLLQYKPLNFPTNGDAATLALAQEPGATGLVYTATRIGWNNTEDVHEAASVYALAFRPHGSWTGTTSYQGNFLAILYGQSNADSEVGYVYKLKIFQVSKTGVVEREVEAFIPDISMPTLSKPMNNVLSWSPDGSKITLASNGELHVYEIDADGAIYNTQTKDGLSNIAAAAFHPHGDIIGVMFNNIFTANDGDGVPDASASASIRFYRHFDGYLDGTALITTGTTSEGTTPTGFVVHDLNWHPSGSLFTVSTDSGMRLFNFQKDDVLENKQSGISSFQAMDRGADVHSARWSPEAENEAILRAALPTASQNLVINRFDAGSLSAGGSLGKVRLVLNNNVTLNSFLDIQDDTIIEGNGFTLTVPDGGRISIANGKTLTLKNLVFKGLRGRESFQFGGITRKYLDSVQFSGNQDSNNTTTLKLDGAVAILESDVFMDRGIIDKVNGGRVDGQGFRIEYDRFVVRRETGGGGDAGAIIEDFAGNLLTLQANRSVRGHLKARQLALGGNTLTFLDAGEWPGGDSITLNNTQGRSGPLEGNAFAKTMNSVTLGDGNLVCYCNRGNGADGCTSIIRVDEFNTGATSTVWSSTQTEKVSQPITTASMRDGDVSQVAWRPGGFRLGSGANSSDKIYGVLVVAAGTQAKFTNSAIANLYDFTDKDTPTFAKVASNAGEFKATGIGASDTTLTATAAAWKNKNWAALALTDGVAGESGKDFIALYNVETNGTVKNNSASVTTNVVNIAVPSVRSAASGSLATTQLKWMAEDRGGQGSLESVRNLVWASSRAGGGEMGIVQVRQSGSQPPTITNAPSIQPLGNADAKIAPHPQETLVAVADGTTIQVYHVDSFTGQMFPIPMFIPMSGVTKINDIQWDERGEILIISTDEGCVLIKINPFGQYIENQYSGAFLSTQNCQTGLMLRDGISLFRDNSEGSVQNCVLATFQKPVNATVKNGTIKINGGMFMLKGSIDVLENTILDGNGQGSFFMFPDTKLTIKSGKTLTITNAYEFGGTFGIPDANGNGVLSNIVFEDSTAKIVLDGVALGTRMGPLYVNVGQWEATTPSGTTSTLEYKGFPVTFGPAVTNAPSVSAGTAAGGFGGGGGGPFTGAGNFGFDDFATEAGKTVAHSFSDRDSVQSVSGAAFNNFGNTEFSGKGFQDFGAFGEQMTMDFGSGDFSEMRYESGAINRIKADVRTSGTGRMVLGDGGRQNIAAGGHFVGGTAADDRYQHDMTGGSATVLESGSQWETGCQTSINWEDCKFDASSGSARFNSVDGAAAPNGKVETLTMDATTLAGNVQMFENSDGSKTTVNIKGINTAAEPTMQFATDDKMKLTKTNLVGSFTMAETVRKLSVDPANAYQNTCGDNCPAVYLNVPDANGAATDVVKQIKLTATEQVIQTYKDTGAGATKSESIALSKVTEVVIVDSSTGLQRRITTDANGAQVAV